MEAFQVELILEKKTVLHIEQYFIYCGTVVGNSKIKKISKVTSKSFMNVNNFFQNLLQSFTLKKSSTKNSP